MHRDDRWGKKCAVWESEEKRRTQQEIFITCELEERREKEKQRMNEYKKFRRKSKMRWERRRMCKKIEYNVKGLDNRNRDINEC